MDYQEELDTIQDRIETGTFEHNTAKEAEMDPQPIVIRDTYKGSDKLLGKRALISGGDSGIGRSVAVHFAREGADVIILYHEHKNDAEETARMVEAEGRKACILQCDQRSKEACQEVVAHIVMEHGKIDILVNNAAYQKPQKNFLDISEDQLRQTFETNIYGYFFLTQAALPHLADGANIIATTSVTSYHGQDMLIDYSCTKGAITTFIRSLAKPLSEKGIRINGVAPGPIWTPFLTATFPKEAVMGVAADLPMKRIGQPCECATAFVFLASDDASYFTGQVLHPNGGGFIST